MAEIVTRSQIVGRVLMTVATLIYGFVPLLVDFTATHVLHPDRTPHSRLHMVQLVLTNSAVAVVALYLLRFREASRGLAAILGLCVLGGFLVSAATMPLDGGALHDKGGVPPVMGVDANLLTFSVTIVLLLAGMLLSGESSPQR